MRKVTRQSLRSLVRCLCSRAQDPQPHLCLILATAMGTCSGRAQTSLGLVQKAVRHLRPASRISQRAPQSLLGDTSAWGPEISAFRLCHPGQFIRVSSNRDREGEGRKREIWVLRQGLREWTEIGPHSVDFWWLGMMAPWRGKGWKTKEVGMDGKHISRILQLDLGGDIWHSLQAFPHCWDCPCRAPASEPFCFCDWSLSLLICQRKGLALAISKGLLARKSWHPLA